MYVSDRVVVTAVVIVCVAAPKEFAFCPALEDKTRPLLVIEIVPEEDFSVTMPVTSHTPTPIDTVTT